MHTKLICSICFNGSLTNQVTNVLTEVVPFCKSGHICIHTYTHVYVYYIYIYNNNNNRTRYSKIMERVFATCW